MGYWPPTKQANDRVAYTDWNAVVQALATWPANANAGGYDLANVGTVYARAYGAPSAAPSDGDIPNSGFAVWYDQDGSRLAFRVRSSTGVLKTGYISLS